MKLQVALLAVGLFVSVGAVGAEMNRAANVASSTTVSTQSAVSTTSSALVTHATTSSINLSVKPSIKGGSSDD